MSTRHSNVAPASLEKPKVGVESEIVLPPAGPESIVAFGGVVSTVKVRDAGVGSGVEPASTARTSKVCVPSGERFGRVRCRGPSRPEEVGVDPALERRGGIVV